MKSDPNLLHSTVDLSKLEFVRDTRLFTSRKLFGGCRS
jgi:hypothetical protein